MPILLLVALLAGAVIGSQLPDIDQWLFFLRGQHRSILTHSPLIPFVLYLAAQGRKPWWSWGGAGLSAAFAAHLARDLFPSRWFGFAEVVVPLFGRIGEPLSVLWLLGSVVACWYIALRLIGERRLVFVVALAGGLAFAVELARGRWPMPVFQPALVLALGFWLATCLPNPVIDGRAVSRRWWATAARAFERP